MLDPIALPENDNDALVAVVKSRPFYIQFARFISTIFSPPVVALPVLLLIALYHQESSSLIFAGIALLFGSIGPLIYVAVGVSLGKFTDMDVSDRRQRTGPYLFGILSSLLGFFVLERYGAPKNIETVLLATALISIVLMVTTFWWKISMHASIFTASVTMLASLYGKIMLPGFLLLVLVCWSRVVLKRHTLGQVCAGSLVSLALMLATIAIRGI